MTNGGRAITFLNKAMEFMMLAAEEMEDTDLSLMIEDKRDELDELKWKIDPEYKKE